MVGLGFFAGIGFTVSLFIATLAFESGAMVEQAKLGTLTASAIAAALGLAFLGLLKKRPS
jgi:NhaA family Na+:H+ antiporter